VSELVVDRDAARGIDVLAGEAQPVATGSTSRRQRGGSRRVRQYGLRLLVIAASVLLWWFATTVVWGSNPVVSKMSPLDAFPALWEGLVDGTLLTDLRASLVRLLSGLAIAFAVGVPLGALIGSNRTIEDATAPVVNFIRMISPLAWAPVVIVAFGVGTAPVLFLIAITAVWPLALGTAAGVRAVAPGWQAVATSLGATKLERLWWVTVPAVRGNVLTSLRLALGVAWIVLVPAEMLGVDSGLGYAVLNARDQLDYAALGGAVLLIGITGFALDSLFRRLLRIDPRVSA
jgi:NitT/TauT family transport system permease protein